MLVPPGESTEGTGRQRSGGKHPGSGQLARHLVAEQRAEPLTQRQQRGDVHAGVKTVAVQQVQQISVAMLPVAFGGNGHPPISPALLSRATGESPASSAAVLALA